MKFETLIVLFSLLGDYKFYADATDWYYFCGKDAPTEIYAMPGQTTDIMFQSNGQTESVGFKELLLSLCCELLV